MLDQTEAPSALPGIERVREKLDRLQRKRGRERLRACNELRTRIGGAAQPQPMPDEPGRTREPDDGGDRERCRPPTPLDGEARGLQVVSDRDGESIRASDRSHRTGGTPIKSSPAPHLA